MISRLRSPVCRIPTVLMPQESIEKVRIAKGRGYQIQISSMGLSKPWLGRRARLPAWMVPTEHQQREGRCGAVPHAEVAGWTSLGQKGQASTNLPLAAINNSRHRATTTATGQPPQTPHIVGGNGSNGFWSASTHGTQADKRSPACPSVPRDVPKFSDPLHFRHSGGVLAISVGIVGELHVVDRAPFAICLVIVARDPRRLYSAIACPLVSAVNSILHLSPVYLISVVHLRQTRRLG